jgi:RHS repeat-associated protein
VQAWWAHQLEGNVATVSLGASHKQFLKLATGVWTTPGPGAQSTLVQHGDRAPYEQLCYGGPPPYAMARGWDLSGLSFDVVGPEGDTQAFRYWHDDFTSFAVERCGHHFGLRLTGWHFPSGNVDVTLTYNAFVPPPSLVGDDPGSLSILGEVSNSLGRRIDFVYGDADDGSASQLLGFTNGLSGGDARGTAMGQGTVYDTTTFTDPMGKVTTVAYDETQRAHSAVSGRLIATVATPDNPAAAHIRYVYDGVGRVEEVDDADNLQIGDHTVAGGHDPYKFYTADGTRGERDDPTGAAYTVTYDTYGHAVRFVDELGRETDQVTDGRGRTISTIYPEGDSEVTTYDVRNNALSLTRNPKPNSAEATAGKTLVAKRTYKEGPAVASCVTQTTCNKVATEVSALNKTTNYTWNSDGTLASIQLPADASGNRPETDYSYATFGTAHLLATKTQAISATKSVTTAYDYDGANHLVPKTVTVDPSGLNLTTAFGTDAQGDVVSVDGPLPGTNDVSYATYDLDRRKLLAIAPDPDGPSGPHNRPATKTVYDDAGRVTETDQDVVASTTGSDFPAIPSTATTNTYDPADNKIRETRFVQGSVTGVTQIAYDGDNRVTCTALRMNPSVYGSLPANPCSLGPQGSTGPDRISKTVYDPAGQVLQELRGLGTANQITYATHGYTPDGQQASVYDALGPSHTTTYGTDGFDRLTATAFPDSTSELLTLDNDGNVKKRVNRAGEAIAMTYDANDRMLTKAVPAAGTTIPANTVTWTYDLTGAVTTVGDSNGNTVAYGRDTLGRVLTEAQTIPGVAGTRTVTSTYDDGNGDKLHRAKLAWPDGYFVAYDYDNLGHMTSAVTSDAVTLASFTYDNYASLATIKHTNAADTVSYGWSRDGDLLALAHNFGSASDNVGFTNTFTPAHQWASAGVSNAAYRYAPTATSGADLYGPVNSVNQYPSVVPNGGTQQPITYDKRGNLISDGVLTLAYDPENHLMTAQTAGGSMSVYQYDPLGRRTAKTVTGTTTAFLHDGDSEIADYDGTGNLLRRYVPGMAIDQPIAMVTAANQRTLFHADKMGSVIAMSQATNGAKSEGPYTYDSYGNCTDVGTGLPCSGGEPFRYTGQRLDPETGLYYYRARYYSSRLGRFMQNDSIGYSAGMNLYAYVGDDPTDLSDPMGLDPAGEDDKLWNEHVCDSVCKANTSQRPSTSSIRRAWERTTGKPWPDDPKTGRPQQAAHVKARADGGDDGPGNIKPQPKDEHMQEHKDNGDFKRWGARAQQGRTSDSAAATEAKSSAPRATGPQVRSSAPTDRLQPTPGMSAEEAQSIRLQNALIDEEILVEEGFEEE